MVVAFWSLLVKRKITQTYKIVLERNYTHPHTVKASSSLKSMTVGKIYNNLKKKPVMGVSEYGCRERKVAQGENYTPKAN